ncbi:hypothetical protein [Hydrogenophaga sp.]|uniref:hypothetical protein n=1 Tax=Hydrogenophaga sp. TaxID=1904254 RepID=UPI0035B052D8
MRHLALILCLSAASLLTGCDMLGIESTAQIAERKEAEGKAIGSACRHAVRSIEDCFRSNPKAGKAAVFAGWKDMDQYMRDNQIVGMPNTAIASPEDAAAQGEESTGDEHAEADTKGHGAKASDKSAEKKPAAGKPAGDKPAHEAATHKS